ncbi:T9SS type A sorting domain-containing protein [Dokdonia pacifica]|uniref:Por secretion system C-terminal sorting domain-containing protein n=1 Tax=Dokdonia pacifica TaxID=1627892 RepID=A0A238WQF2_9FLAO|nr:T9SS type A sorting domain-containing protein [Dokdonia pacifica]SNR48772.1 Por secretion system C-terminal sorting domain-containing protein [Dokdonia pacifica]
MMRTLLCVLFLCLGTISIHSQESIAREWNEELLEAVRNDFARPTVHARNLFHSSVLMYDAWAIFDETSVPLFLGKSFGGFQVPYEEITIPTDEAELEATRDEVISYAVFRLLMHRFANSPGADDTLPALEAKFSELSYDASFTDTDYSSGSFAALGNYMAEQMIAFGLQDGSNEDFDYGNTSYLPVNDPLLLDMYEETNDIDPNRWQPLSFETFIDQSGNPIPTQVPDFLSPEWGIVTPFALSEDDLEIFPINGFDYYVYNDPGSPSYIQDSDGDALQDPYKWGFGLVASWSKQLDPADGVMIDISPASIGNIQSYPTTFEEYQTFYDFENGGDASIGHTVNPATGQPYETQMVPRADYARVLAEFWADGPDSETPPGHWFTILNYVNDNPLLEKKIGGEGETLSDLEWDIKTYFLLGAAMHDSAVNTWGLKGYYDYVRPISAIRYMAGKGQSDDNSLTNYDPHGLPLIDGLIEVIEEGDPLAGDANEFVGKLKMNAWKGPDFIEDPDTDVAGVDWIYANRWWPYQRPTFVTPPFAGYISGHSTFSSAAAQILTLVTGDPFFPGGMGTFDIAQNEFLVFEEGPSVDMTLQWATYKDASDQTSLSRIWGGIHPPIDDIPGRFLGEEIGNDVYDRGLAYFSGEALSTEEAVITPVTVFPNPVANLLQISGAYQGDVTLTVYSIDGKRVLSETKQMTANSTTLDVEKLTTGIYFLSILDKAQNTSQTVKIIKQ